MSERLPDYRLDEPAEDDLDARIEAAEREGERQYEAWYATFFTGGPMDGIAHRDDLLGFGDW